jgi:hypothetical protein
MPVTVVQGFTKAIGQAEPLPLPPELNGCGWKIRRGQMVMVAGVSGMGKSTFTQWLLTRMNLHTLYGSADMDPWDATVNVAAMMTGDEKATIEEAMQSGHDGYYLETLAASKLQFFFDSTPSLDDLVAELDAYVEVWDAWPDVVVVDNLINVQDSIEYGGKMNILSELHSLAHSTGITVFILHHALESQQKDETMPPAKKHIDNKVTHYPELVLTIALDQVNELFRVACVKQRGGPADATGKTFLTLKADPARCQYRLPQSQAVTDFWKGIEE